MDSTTTCYFTFVRHAQAESNVKVGEWENLLHSATETPLTELGREQAIKVAERLKGEPFQFAYTSDLSRAFDTGSAIVKRLNNNLHLIKDENLRGKNFGRFENKPCFLFSEALRESQKPKEEFHDDSMESNEALENRGKTFLRERIEEILVRGRRDANILVTSHGGLIRAMVLYLKKNAKTDNLPELKKLYEMWPKNVGVSKLKITVDKVSHQILDVDTEGRDIYCNKHLEDVQVNEESRQNSDALDQLLFFGKVIMMTKRWEALGRQRCKNNDQSSLHRQESLSI